jgi:hypothetical protein
MDSDSDRDPDRLVGGGSATRSPHFYSLTSITKLRCMSYPRNRVRVR